MCFDVTSLLTDNNNNTSITLKLSPTGVQHIPVDEYETNSNICKSPLHKKCPNTEFFLVRIPPYSVQMQKNTDQKNLRIWTPFPQWPLIIFAKSFFLDV